MDVVILDAHREEDGRIKRHVKYLVDQGLGVYRINYNYIDRSAKPGIFSHFGEKGLRINVNTQGKIKLFYHLIYRLRGKRLAECLKALEILKFDPVPPSVIHVHDPQLLPLARMLVNKKLFNSKIVYDRHEVYERFTRHLEIPVSLIYEMITRNSISGVVTVSEHHVDMTHKLFPNQYVITVPNYPLSAVYDRNIINNKVQSCDPHSQINAIYIGSLNNLLDRDVDLLTDIASNVLQLYSDVRFTVGGTNLDAQSRLKLDDLSRKHNGRFQFLGPVPREKTIELTQKAHIGFFLLRPDTHYWVKASPNKVFEYLICGVVPIIRADVDHSDVLRKCSLIFSRSDDDRVIIKAVLNLLGNPEKLKEYMKNAYELSADYTWESVADRYIELYNTLLYPKIDPKPSIEESPLAPKNART
jgi:glycosyltransferase involved in cell wall biosynthesis